MLSTDEVTRFETDGVLGPFEAWTPEEMASIRDRLDAGPLVPVGETEAIHGQSRHLDSRLVYDMCTHPAILERMASLLGPDLVLWRSNFFVKQPGAKEIPWHQDANYWPIDPPINVTAWVAVDPATLETSCVQIIPGSHHRVLEHVPSPSRMEFPEMADPSAIDDSRAIAMQLEPGSFFLFNERTLHRSAPNTSGKRRMGLAVRMTTPDVRVDHDQLFKGHTVIVVRGTDRRGLNRVSDPPETT